MGVMATTLPYYCCSLLWGGTLTCGTPRVHFPSAWHSASFFFFHTSIGEKKCTQPCLIKAASISEPQDWFQLGNLVYFCAEFLQMQISWRKHTHPCGSAFVGTSIPWPTNPLTLTHSDPNPKTTSEPSNRPAKCPHFATRMSILVLYKYRNTHTHATVSV